MPRLSGRALLLALPLSLGCSVDASGLWADDATTALDAADDGTTADALFEVGPPDDTGPPDTLPLDAPLFEAPDAGCFDATKDCPPPDVCMVATCTAGVCGQSPQTARTPCSSTGGKLCDGAGACVACLVSGDCTTTAAPTCVSKQCVAASCMDMLKNGAESDVDCGGSCSKCPLGKACGGNADCQSNLCGAGNKCACNADAQCGSGKYCDAGACKVLIATGKACMRFGECTSGFCVDGFCCNVACNGTCQACAGPKKQMPGGDGTCGPAKDGTDPHATCTAAPPCGNTGQCSSGACQQAGATINCGAPSCSGSTLFSARSCSGTGTCSAAVATNCAPYLCDATSGKCKTTCTLASDCDSTTYCNGMNCVAKLTSGTKCMAASSCATGFCVDGVCCESACSGTCRSCNVTSTPGVCANIPLNGDDTAPTCSGTNTCNGSGACLLAAGQSCTANGDCASNDCKGMSPTCK